MEQAHPRKAEDVTKQESIYCQFLEAKACVPTPTIKMPLPELTQKLESLWKAIEERKLHKMKLDFNLSSFIQVYKDYERVREEVMDSQMAEQKKAHQTHLQHQTEMSRIHLERDLACAATRALEKRLEGVVEASREALAGRQEAEKVQQEMTRKLLDSMNSTDRARAENIDQLCEQVEVEKAHKERESGLRATGEADRQEIDCLQSQLGELRRHVVRKT